MATYARVQGGVVAELFTTAGDMAKLFPPALVWLDVSSLPAAAVGWITRAGGVTPAPQAVAHVPVVAAPVSMAASLAALKMQMLALQAQLNQLSASARENS